MRTLQRFMHSNTLRSCPRHLSVKSVWQGIIFPFWKLQAEDWHTKISVPHKHDECLTLQMQDRLLRLITQHRFLTICFSLFIHGWNQRKAERQPLDLDRGKTNATEQVTRTNSFWSSRKSFTLTSICAVREEARLPKHSAFRNDKSRFGFKTVAWKWRRMKN